MLSFTEALTIGAPLVFTPEILLLALFGTIVGLTVGALPGLTSAMAVALMIPMTYSLSPAQAFAILLPAYAAGTFGGSIAAILLNIPGTGAAVMTTFDGYPMRERGEAARAIAIAATSSVFGGLLSAIVLITFAPRAAIWALQLGAHEYFVVALFGLLVIAFVSVSPFLGMISGLFGLLLATVGNDPAGAYPRFTYEQTELVGGLQFVPVMIGLFGISEVLYVIDRGITHRPPVRQKTSGVMRHLAEAFRNFGVLFRSSLIGLIIGVMPGSGPTIGSVVSYGIEKRFGRCKARMGYGAPQGVIAAEAANNGGTGGALVPMFALGIPGDAVTAILIGALLIHGLQPGPYLFLEQPALVSSLFLLFVVGNVLFLILGLLGLPVLVRILQTPACYLLPIVALLCIVGSYAAASSFFDCALAIGFGVFGYLLKKLGVPVAPMILGFILGPLLEDNLRRALILDDGNILKFFERPITLLALAGVILLVIAPWVFKKTGKN